MSVGELAERVAITPANLAVLKNGRAKAVRVRQVASSFIVVPVVPRHAEPPRRGACP